MTTTEAGTPIPAEVESDEDDLNCAICDYVRTYARRHGRKKTMETFGVSLYTLWRFLDRGHIGRSLPKAVMRRVGESVEEVDAATWAVEAAERIIANFNRSARNRRPAGPPCTGAGGRPAATVRRSADHR